MGLSICKWVLGILCPIVGVTGGILMLANHWDKDGEVLPATCKCTSIPYHYTDSTLVSDGQGGTRVEEEDRCSVNVLATTTPESMTEMEVHINHISSHCSHCPGPTKCYINSDSGSVYFSRWLAENALESYMAGCILVGMAGFSCLTLCLGYLIGKAVQRHRSRPRKFTPTRSMTITTPPLVQTPAPALTPIVEDSLV